MGGRQTWRRRAFGRGDLIRRLWVRRMTQREIAATWGVGGDEAVASAAAETEMNSPL